MHDFKTYFPKPFPEAYEIVELPQHDKEERTRKRSWSLNNWGNVDLLVFHERWLQARHVQGPGLRTRDAKSNMTHPHPQELMDGEEQ